MTGFGRDNIPFEELDLRLSQLDDDLVERVQKATKEHPVTSLMINFFFKGGRKELGAEFLHKSFREFLFAEAIVESLKNYGPPAGDSLSVWDSTMYWRELDPVDSRYDFRRRLAKMLAPQWISREVASFLEGLIEWELSRAYGKASEELIGTSTAPFKRGRLAKHSRCPR